VRSAERIGLFADSVFQFPNAQSGKQQRLGSGEAAGGCQLRLGRGLTLGGTVLAYFVRRRGRLLTDPFGRSFADWEMTIHAGLLSSLQASFL
jgi:hypothetical protein